MAALDVTHMAYQKRRLMIRITCSEFRANLAQFMDKANNERVPIYVTRKGAEPVVIISAAEYASLDETAYLLSTRANRERLLQSMHDANSGHLEEHDLIR